MPRRDDDNRAWAPSPWVVRFLRGVEHKHQVLDLACGAGRHISPCISSGRPVTAVDRDTAEIRRRYSATPEHQLKILEIDLEDGRPFPFPPGSFDGVIVTNYLWRPILSDIIATASPGGVLIYETFQTGHERHGKPTNSAFLLRPGELLAAVRDRLHVIAYEEVRLFRPDRVVQRICAVGPDHAWLKEPPPL